MILHHVSSFRRNPAVDLVGALQRWLNCRPDRPAFTYLVDGEDETIQLTLPELDHRARAIAANLMDSGISGRKALLLFPPGLEFVTALFGCFYANVVAIPAFPPRRNRNMGRLRAISQDSKATVALTTDDVSRRLKNLIVGATDLEGIRWIATDNIEDDWADSWRRPNIQADELAVLQYTSGSTGQPKGVMLSHNNLLANLRVITEAFKAHDEDISMTWLPTYHDMGLIGGVLEPVFVGTPVVMMSPMAFLQQPVRWLRAITRYGVTVAGGPNFAYDLCTKKIADADLAELDLSKWTLAFNGAEPVRDQTLKNFANKFAPCGFRKKAFHPCYGMAESSLMITGGRRLQMPTTPAFDAAQLDVGIVQPSDANTPSRTLVGCGAALEQHTVLIVDPTTEQVLPTGKIGEVWVSGPSVGLGYLNKPEDTQATFKNTLPGYPGKHFLRTGDLGFFHDGQLFVNGRIKDMIIVRGVNKYPQDIEMTVEQSDDRLRTGSAAAFAIEKDGREQLVIVAEAERIAQQNWDEVIQQIRARVARVHDLAPDAIVLIRAGSIPKTSSGKIQRHACRAGFQGGTLSVIADWQLGSLHRAEVACTCAADRGGTRSVLEVVCQAVRGVGQERVGELSAQTNVVELGLDSLERVEIVQRIENELGITFSQQELIRIETCGEIANSAERQLTELGDAQRGQIPESHYQFDKLPEYQQLKRTQSAFANYGYAMPYFGVHEGNARATTVVNGCELVNFASYNYIGMSGDPDVNRAAQAAITRYGTSVSASRIVSGERPVHRQLEQEIASMLRVQDALVFVGGHSTNETTIGHLFGNRDLILHDALAHNSIIQGALLSGADRRPFPHNDWEALAAILEQQRRNYRRVLIAIEGVYSMDGDYPELPQFIDVAQAHRAFLMVDEAHSAGTMGDTGRGISQYFQLDPTRVDIWMGTLSKSFGSCGGYIAGSTALIEYLRFTAPGFVYSVGMPPSNAAAALAAIRKMLANPERVVACQRRSKLFLDLAGQMGLDTGLSSETPIVPVIVRSSKIALALSQRLAERGINVQPIMYPAVAESAARLRFFITSEHTEAQIERTVLATAEELAKLKGESRRNSPNSHIFDGRSAVSDISAKRAI